MNNLDKEYLSLVSKVGMELDNARKNIYKNINSTLVETYWKIGKYILEYEQKGKIKAKYGSKVIQNLSKDLTKKYGKGFEKRNLEQMRKFYNLFPIAHTLYAQLSWSHYKIILKIKDKLARNFYVIETKKNNWSCRELERQINSSLFERVALSTNKKEIINLSKKGQIIESPKDLFKDPLILEFLNLDEKPSYTENDLEQKIIDNLQKFLLELGKGFTFVSRQQKITIGEKNFYADLIFYNRLLKCFVILELKIGELKHQDIGQLQMYVNYYDRTQKTIEENLTVGILVCAKNNKAVVEFTLPKNNQQIFASEYKLYLPNKKELEQKLKEIVS